MKKSLLAAGAVAALGGLGFAGSANAYWIAQDIGDVPATTLSAATNTGVGHILITPYFSTGESNTTLLSIVNTDTENGKAVKVRFRGAANSDDVLDFTVLMSAGDVWTANVSQGPDGISRLSTPDTSCVLPNIPTGDGQSFMTTRLPALSGDALAAHTREGYVEWLNMADIPEGKGTAQSKLSKAITHKNNVADCTPDVLADLMDPEQTLTVTEAAELGIKPPTGGLMGNWTIFNTANVTSYGGPSSAIVALNADGQPDAGRLFFSPQIGPSNPEFGSVDYTKETADPVLLSGNVDVLPFDLPDLSTPYVSTSVDPWHQADVLSASMAASKVMNEWTAGSSNGTDFSTDWVFSQPTRRYHAAMLYGEADGKVTYTPLFGRTANFYGEDTMMTRAMGPEGMYGEVLCLATGQVGYTIYNREEGTIIPTWQGEWSPAVLPGKAPGFCGEVATLTFGGAESKSLNAKLTTYQVQNLPEGGAGWMAVTMKGYEGYGLPVIGFAANTFAGANGSNVGNYGDAITHRYERPLTGYVPTPVDSGEEGGPDVTEDPV